MTWASSGPQGGGDPEGPLAQSPFPSPIARWDPLSAVYLVMLFGYFLQWPVVFTDILNSPFWDLKLSFPSFPILRKWSSYSHSKIINKPPHSQKIRLNLGMFTVPQTSDFPAHKHPCSAMCFRQLGIPLGERPKRI